VSRVVLLKLLRDHPDDKFELSLVDSAIDLPPIDEINVEVNAPITGKLVLIDFYVYCHV
jgi:hypothetical protein